jgi:hypothetical protein
MACGAGDAVAGSSRTRTARSLSDPAGAGTSPGAAIHVTATREHRRSTANGVPVRAGARTPTAAPSTGSPAGRERASEPEGSDAEDGEANRFTWVTVGGLILAALLVLAGIVDCRWSSTAWPAHRHQAARRPGSPASRRDLCQATPTRTSAAPQSAG